MCIYKIKRISFYVSTISLFFFPFLDTFCFTSSFFVNKIFMILTQFFLPLHSRVFQQRFFLEFFFYSLILDGCVWITKPLISVSMRRKKKRKLLKMICFLSWKILYRKYKETKEASAFYFNWLIFVDILYRFKYSIFVARGKIHNRKRMSFDKIFVEWKKNIYSFF